MGVPDPTRDLVLRARRGDRGALDALARRFLRPAYAVALAVVGRPADAEDVAQDAFVVAIEQLETCREPAAFAAWLLRIVRTRALNALDRRRLRDVPRDEERTPARGISLPDAESSAMRGPLLAALAALSLPQREVVLLHDLEGWSHAEIAAALGVSEVMSRQHLFLARRTLRERLADRATPEVAHGR